MQAGTVALARTPRSVPNERRHFGNPSKLDIGAMDAIQHVERGNRFGYIDADLIERSLAGRRPSLFEASAKRIRAANRVRIDATSSLSVL